MIRKTSLLILGAAAALSTGAPAFAHGTLEMPISRVYACYLEGPENPKSEACKAAKSFGGSQPFYDWSGVRQGAADGRHKKFVPDGRLCSGGGATYRGLDLARPDWIPTSIIPTASGEYDFVWRAPALHATSYYRYYVTKDGWDPKQPLKWSDLQQFASVKGADATLVGNQYRMTLKLPKLKKGPHVIYSIWQRADSPEAFYACSDVTFPGGDTGPKGWEDQGPLVANNALSAGSVVTLRVFDPSGRDAGSHSVTLTKATGRAELWPFTLANEVNAQSEIFQIGVQIGKSKIEPERSATANRVYLSTSYAGYTYLIDKDIPQTGPTEWVEGATYEVGQVVIYGGRRYTCLQAHTAFVGAGWQPDRSPTLWKKGGKA